MTAGKPINVAVALNWDGESAPRVTAKGRGELAEQIVARAREHGVALNEDAALVEILAQVELGQPVPEMIFTAVAEVIAFAYRLNDELPDHVRARLGRTADLN